ncbi:hypothetical protein OSB04_023746 [Centaurea solstitialis]|uniref:Uncharacterized protein n=1 Tax=Centaurea solstitialis TaxID=347529 RepID=A0AA38WBE6_9ASTR|nr:hypothetical protein OSB04_023746 [Centaurea solstitialis]
MDESKKGFIPMQHGIVLSKTQCPVSSQDQDKMKSVPYASAIGSIMYAMLCTRPDVAYSVSVTSRYQQNPGEPHWVVVKNILKYLRRTKDMFLVFGGSEDEISVNGYSDASFQTDRDDFRSQSGYVFTLNGGAISWKSSKQDTIADSTTEAEYIAASDAAKEAVWLRNFLSDLRVVTSVSRLIDIFCDNSGAVAQAKEPREHHKSRYMLRKYHLIREIIGRGDVWICKIPTEDNVADPLTKPLARVKHEAHANSIGMQYLVTRCVLIQKDRIIAYASRKLKVHERSCATYDLELQPMVFALKNSRHYSYRTKCTVYVNRKSFQYILYWKIPILRQRSWAELLSDHDCEIRYHPDKAQYLKLLVIVKRELLNVSSWNGLVRFRKEGNLCPRYVGPFESVEQIGLVSHKLKLHLELSEIHETFHVSNLKKILANELLVAPLEDIQVAHKCSL